jgi:hypothetical protein
VRIADLTDDRPWSQIGIHEQTLFCTVRSLEGVGGV